MDDQLKAYSPDLNLIAVLNKKWDECTDAERIMKLREECRGMQYLTNRIYALEAEIAKLREHSHVDGKVVVPMQPNHGGVLMGGGIASQRNNLA